MTQGWICLLYHDVTAGRLSQNGGPQRFAVSARAFESQLDMIRTAGLRACSIEEAAERAGDGCVAISFDDGDLGQYENAFPALARRGMTATFFITTSWVGRERFVTWEQLREMRDAGMSVQSHTHTHPFLSELDATQLTHELRQSKQAIDSALEQDTATLALPGGDEPRRALRHLLLDSGYSVVATSRWGSNPSTDRASRSAPLRVRRCTVQGEPSAAEFEKILLGDPWLHIRRRTRDRALNGVRAALGPSRYAPLRRKLLDWMGKPGGGSAAG